MVAFAGNKRELGVGVKNQQARNLRNTLKNLKVQLVEPNLSNRLDDYKVQLIGPEIYPSTSFFHVQYRNKFKCFSSVQIVAMLFSKLKSDANVALEHSGEEVTSCVIAVPSYFNAREQKSVLLAAGICGLNCEFMIKETTALAINYGFYKTFKSTLNVVFVDFGQCSLQISACAFNERSLKIIAEAHKLVGGRNIDELLVKHVIKALHITEAKANDKNFMHGMLNGVRNLKEKMSANTGKLSLNIQHLPGYENAKFSIERSEMENICQALFEEIKDLMKYFLTESKLALKDINSVEIVGGSSRIPAFMNLIKEVFGKTPLATMDSGEAISRGCFLRSILSEKRKDFLVEERPTIDDCALRGLLEIGQVLERFVVVKCVRRYKT